MNIKEFSYYVQDAVTKVLEDKYKVEMLYDYGDTDNCMLKVTMDDGTEACLYMKAFYYKYIKESEPFEETIKDILQNCDKSLNRLKIADMVRHNYSYAKEKIRGCLINTEKNIELLQRLVHREYMDLSLVYSVDIDVDSDRYGIRVTREMLKNWGISENKLFIQMKENLKNLKTNVTRLSKVVGIDDDLPICVAFTEDYRYGSVQMLNEETLNRVTELMDGSFYILPSSINELIFAPYDSDEAESDPVELASIVKDVNATTVPVDEVLSDHVYFYDHKTENITIAA